ncbi:MAG TPA: hypothetical protein VFC42_07465 [Methylomirabilota bacterium]|nr:hypothetical protein [Methylomirabilota bacterium]
MGRLSVGRPGPARAGRRGGTEWRRAGGVTAGPAPGTPRAGRRVLSGLVGLALGLLAVAAAGAPGVGQPAPPITGGPWLNGPALSPGDLRGRVVLVEFWTFG